MAKPKRKYCRTDLPLKIIKLVAGTGLAAAGVVLAAALPGAVIALSPFLKGKDRQERERWTRNRITKTIWELQQRGFLEKDSQGRLSLTAKGQRLLLKYQLKELSIKKPKKWDGKWRVVVFDVWERRRTVRNLLRETLQSLGFVKLQASVWVYPYECEEIIGLLRTELKLSPAIQYLIVERMDRDDWLRKEFDLPSKKYILS